MLDLLLNARWPNDSYSSSTSIFRFGTDPKLLEWYVDVSKGCGLLDPVNLKHTGGYRRRKRRAPADVLTSWCPCCWCWPSCTWAAWTTRTCTTADCSRSGWTASKRAVRRTVACRTDGASASAAAAAVRRTPSAQRGGGGGWPRRRTADRGPGRTWAAGLLGTARSGGTTAGANAVPSSRGGRRAASGFACRTTPTGVRRRGRSFGFGSTRVRWWSVVAVVCPSGAETWKRCDPRRTSSAGLWRTRQARKKRSREKRPSDNGWRNPRGIAESFRSVRARARARLSRARYRYARYPSSRRRSTRREHCRTF